MRETDTYMKNIIGCLLYAPHLEIEPEAYVCALTGNQTSNLLVYETMLQPTEPGGQGYLYFYGLQYYRCPYSTPSTLRFAHLHPAFPLPSPWAITTLLSTPMGPVSVLWPIPSPSFIQVPPPLSPLTAVSLFHVFMPLFLFC